MEAGVYKKMTSQAPGPVKEPQEGMDIKRGVERTQQEPVTIIPAPADTAAADPFRPEDPGDRTRN